MHVSKAGHTPEEYEDAASIAVDTWPAAAAVADGATESAFARVWAEQIAQGAATEAVITTEALEAALPAWQTAWAAEAEEQSDALPWYAAAKADEGAFATLLVCAFFSDGTWQALSVGDCGLFQIQDGACVDAWPFEDPDAFHNRPDLLASRSSSVPPVRTRSGAWTSGDAFLLATDAVAAWLLRTGPAAALDLTPDTFPDAVATARADDLLRNDDATLLRLQCAAAPRP
jgi:hypothetical protein